MNSRCLPSPAVTWCPLSSCLWRQSSLQRVHRILIVFNGLRAEKHLSSRRLPAPPSAEHLLELVPCSHLGWLGSLLTSLRGKEEHVIAVRARKFGPLVARPWLASALQARTYSTIVPYSTSIRQGNGGERIFEFGVLHPRSHDVFHL